MASTLLRGLKGVNFSCTSPTADHHRPPLYRRSLDHLLSRFATSHPSLPTASTSARHLLHLDDGNDDDLGDPFDADVLPSFLPPSGSPSSPSPEEERLRKVRREEHASCLRSTVGGSASFHAGVGGSTSGWVRFHTVDGGDSPAICRPPRADPREVRLPLSGGVKGKVAVCSSLDLGSPVLNSPPPASSPSSSSGDQVVVLRVSLHCKACEGKVRKHISRMPGVTSYNIDFASKKVTVIGDVTPSDVLSSLSKVKSAQIWSSSPVPPPS